MSDMIYEKDAVWTDVTQNDPLPEDWHQLSIEEATPQCPVHNIELSTIDGTCTHCRLDEESAKANAIQPGLRVGRYLSIAQRYAAWRQTSDGRVVFGMLCDKALQLRRRGWRHYSHKAIIETIRYDQAVQVGPEGGFKINDHYSAHLAREAMRTYRDLDGFFEVRELRAG